MLKNQTKNSLLFPITIVIIGIIISGGIFIYRTSHKTNPDEINKNISEGVGIRPITSEDKILGNPNADVIIVVYSDFECPYCKIFHSTMNEIMYEYGRDGKVAWIFRQFPLEPKHKYARGAAIASECVYRLGGNEQFWTYSNILFSSSTEILNKENLEKIATDIGIEKEKYNSVEIKSAFPMTAHTTKEILESVCKDSSVKHFAKEDKTLIAGFVAKYKGVEWDASVKGVVDRLRKTLKEQ
jgi:hypothetical protein